GGPGVAWASRHRAPGSPASGGLPHRPPLHWSSVQGSPSSHSAALLQPPEGAERKVASTMYQWVSAPKVRLPCWGPAALARMSSRSEEALPFRTSRTYGTIPLLPGVAKAGWPLVRTAATTSSPTGTGAVGPALA